MNVLIVDDNEINRKLLRVMLQAEELHTMEAADGREALQILEREKVDVIVSDILMPNMDGYRLCYEVRKSERLKTIPFIIFTSTYDSTQDEKLAMRFGADRYIRRPAPASEILKAIREVTARAQQPPIPSMNPIPSMQLQEEAEVMKAYSEQLVMKLEKRNIQLQCAHAKITEMNRILQKHTKQIEANETQFRGIFENILDVFFRMDMRGNIQLASPSIQRYGYLPEELIGTNIVDLFVDPADAERITQTLAERESLEDWEVTLKRKAGEPFVASLSTRVLTDNRGRKIGRETFIRDITERKRLEAQFLHAQKMEGIGRLAGGIAHDFNNLLTVIMGCTELAEDTLPEDHPACDNLQHVLEACESAAGLTRQLLAFARRHVIELKVINLNDLIARIGSMLHRLIGEDIELVTLLDNALGLVKVDAGLMEQVLVNLAINSRDAMPGGGKLTLETANVTLDTAYARQHAEVVPGEFVMLAVADMGEGMSEEVKAHIFEPFFTTKGIGKGTGLGLATCYGIVKQSGGHIWLYSESGRGTTFKIYLPRVEAAIDVLYTRIESGDLPGGTEIVLVVEDDPQLRDVILQELRGHGYRALAAANGGEALRIAAETTGKIDLLLTDVVMPQMGGRELVERFRAARPYMKVLYTSGYTDDAIIHHGVLDAGIAFLQKPFTSGALARKVREVLDAPSGGDSEPEGGV